MIPLYDIAMNRIALTFSLLAIFVCSSIALAGDRLDQIIQNKISSGLTNLGNEIAESIPGEGDTEVTISEQDNYDIKFSILAVRSLFSNPYKQITNDHLYFTQIRISNHEPFANGDERTVLNAGLGFRMLVNDNNAIAGLNIFHDYEFDEGHQRGSVGVEYLTNSFDFYANIYERLSDNVNYKVGSQTAIEEVVNGYDYSIVGQIPYMPWGKLIYNGYNWDKTGSDLEGKRISLEANLLEGMIFEYGRNDIEDSSNENFYQLTFRWPSNHLTPTIFSDTITDYAFVRKNMKSEMLHKVRRTNNIITEKRSGGLVIARGS